MDELKRMRQEYRTGSLVETEMASNPFDEFEVWLKIAIASGIPEPNAMVMASATPNGRPSARVVLLKELNDHGFVFYTNYESRKGKELQFNPYAAVVFDWHEIERQIRIEGVVEKVNEAMSDDYFNSRPDETKTGAWASPQSHIVNGREELDELQKKYSDQFSGSIIPRPPYWGGFLIRPTIIEFWQGRLNRMHDRIVYERVEKIWRKYRLAP